MLERFQQIKKMDEEDNLIGIYHDFMRTYGYIPLEEWKKMPIPLVLELLDKIEEENRKSKIKMPRRGR